MSSATQNIVHVGAAARRYCTRSSTRATETVAASTPAPSALTAAPETAASATNTPVTNQVSSATETQRQRQQQQQPERPRLTLHLNARERTKAMAAAHTLEVAQLALDMRITMEIIQNGRYPLFASEVRPLLDQATEAIRAFGDIAHPGQPARDCFEAAGRAFLGSLQGLVYDL